MLIARAPLRLSLAGGGTDIPAYSQKYGGAVVIATIDRYAYAMVSETDAPTVQISSSDYDGAPYERPAREILKRFGMDRAASIFFTSELPPFSGMAAIRAGSIALIRALSQLHDRRMTAIEIAEMACAITANRVGPRRGVADCYGVACGAISFIEVDEGRVVVEPIVLSDDLHSSLESRFMLFSTGRLQKTREAIDAFGRAAERNRAGVIEALHEVKAAAVALRQVLQRGEVDRVGGCLDRTWRASRGLARGMTDPWVDQWYEAALNAGASGGKVNGIGGAGFLVLCCEPDRQARVAEVMQSMGLSQVAIRLETRGVSMLLNEALPTPSLISPSTAVGDGQVGVVTQ